MSKKMSSVFNNYNDDAIAKKFKPQDADPGFFEEIAIRVDNATLLDEEDMRSKYCIEFGDIAKEILELGYSRSCVAKNLRVSPAVIRNWEKKHEDFAEKMREGEASAHSFYVNAAKKYMLIEKDKPRIDPYAFTFLTARFKKLEDAEEKTDVCESIDKNAGMIERILLDEMK